MTDMRRVTVSIPDSMDRRILALRKKKAFARCSYSELVRRMVELGMSQQAMATDRIPTQAS